MQYQEALMTSTATATAATAAGTRPRLRLTRRGRMLRSALLMFVLVVAVLVAAVAWGSDVVATSGGGQPVPVRTVTVQPGQTLWDIAADSGVGGDPRDVVSRIQQLNSLADPGALQIGQSLAVPLPE
jgi:LysM repeat protein